MTREFQGWTWASTKAEAEKAATQDSVVRPVRAESPWLDHGFNFVVLPKWENF